MSLIICPECNKKVSNLAKSCPNCGYPIIDNFIKNEVKGSSDIIKKDKKSSDLKVKELLNNIRRKNILTFIFSSIRTIVLVSVTMLILFAGIFQVEDNQIIIMIIMLLSAVLFSWFSIIDSIENFKKVFLPIKSSEIRGLQKYGDIFEIADIVYDNKSNPLLETKEILIGYKIIIFKNDYSLCPIDDLICLYKYIHKTNYVVDYIGLNFKDKYGRTNLIKWNEKNENEIELILNHLLTVNPNITLGYNSDSKKETIKLPKSIF